MQVCDEKEKNLKEENTFLRTHLAESKGMGDINSNKKKHMNEYYVEVLEGVIEKLRKQLEEKDQ